MLHPRRSHLAQRLLINNEELGTEVATALGTAPALMLRGKPIFFTEEESKMIKHQVHNHSTAPPAWQYYVDRATRKV
ncbi:MAG: hypothetical protein M1358_01015 [Chloroflexi bacterium]|nr:hypothetical protein [Chloroflexota bacterium]